MIIDFHTHTFPETIAERAIIKLASTSGGMAYTKGTADALQKSTAEAGIDCSVILPVATSITQHETINRVAAMVNKSSKDTHLLSFGGIHPDNENYKEILRDIKNAGMKGIKLHPVFEGVYADDIRIKRIVAEAESLGLITVLHAGYDVSYPMGPGGDFATVPHLLELVKETDPKRLVLAHMGGWECWNDVETYLAGADVYFDTSYALTPLRAYGAPHKEPDETHVIRQEQFLRISRKHGIKKILFGSDSPWANQHEALERLENTGLTEEERKMIEGKNAAALLSL